MKLTEEMIHEINKKRNTQMIIAVKIDDMDNGSYIAKSVADCRDAIDAMIFESVMRDGIVCHMGHTSGIPITNN
jgi:hypothetical protein